MRNLAQRKSLGLLTTLLIGSTALAQNAASPTPPPDDINPGVDTSSPSQTPSSANSPNASEAAPAAAAPNAGSSATPPAQGQAAKPAAQTGAAQTGARGKALDRLELDTTQITGNRELPKVLYIVPWKRSDLGDLVGKPVNSLLDEVLAPVDRDVFQRENRYYRALTPGADEGASTGPDPKAAPQRAKPTNPLPPPAASDPPKPPRSSGARAEAQRRPRAMRDRSQLFTRVSFSFRRLA